MKDFLAISVAAIFGANLRYLLGRLSVRHFGLNFPYGTLAINIIGSFIVGLFVIWSTERVLADPRWRLLILEDCDELIRGDAKSGTGQSLARLLNLTDGILGQEYHDEITGAESVSFGHRR